MQDYKPPHYWKGAFCFAARELVDPQISLCDHTTVDNDYEGGRSDSASFQKEEDLAAIDQFDPVRNVTANRLKCMCSKLKDRMDVYGIAGEGTFGSVFLARERSDGNQNPDDLKHYAIKVQKHETLLSAMQAHYWDPPNGPVPDNRQAPRYVPEEALIMLFLSHSERFPNLDSVYTHDRFQAIIMSPCIDYSTERQPLSPGDYTRRFPAFTARYLLTKDHRPLLHINEGCKVATQLFQAMRQLADMNAWHNDISVNNILVDKNLNAQMIDLGDFAFSTDEQVFFERQYMYVPFQEYQMSPELAMYVSTNVGRSAEIDVSHDLRHEAMWKFGVILYGIVHGFWPWNEPPKNGGPHPDLLDARVFTESQHVLHRRYRILNDPLPIDENLPQDCKDVLQAMFSKNPEDRPTLEELEGYPWFSQWARETRFFQRPFSKDFRHSCSRRNN